jgi:putative Mg2+ transporter-C (MgtC) family protein
MTPELSVVAHTALAFALGWAIGYERVYRGRSSGTQVYCLVSMASCALTSATGFSSFWFGHGELASTISATSVIGSLLTGIGFLGAGIIVKAGANIRGLTTAASIWSSSAIGILVGIDFLAAAFGLAALFILCMAFLPYLEQRLPGRAALVVTLRYRENMRPQEEQILSFLKDRGLTVQRDSISIAYDGHRFELEFLVAAAGVGRDRSPARVAEELPSIAAVESFTVARTSRA